MAEDKKTFIEENHTYISVGALVLICGAVWWVAFNSAMTKSRIEDMSSSMTRIEITVKERLDDHEDRLRVVEKEVSVK